jgi:1-acyl-sn-glycerol-3-phosphate acyltransferase
LLYAVVRLVCLAVFRLGFRIRAFGRDNVPRQGPLLLASNHVSLLDPPVVGSAAPRPLHYMAKAELFRVPILGGLIRRLNAYPVEREGADAAALRQALTLLRAGGALLVFPEGTRGVEGRLGAARPGTGMLAALSDAPVVPVYIQGTGRVLPRGASRPRTGRISVWYGPPLRFPRTRGREHYQEISDEIMAAIGRLKVAAERTGRTRHAAAPDSALAGAPPAAVVGVDGRTGGPSRPCSDETAAGMSPACEIH